MTQTLYRKYRPQQFKDVVGQKHIVTTLTNALKTDRIAHAYLFTGSRGTGKTTFARLFATAVNTTKRKGFTPVAKDVAARLRSGQSLDIIEIDAASNTGVDNIRDLRSAALLPTTEAAYKVYIIDEVHMLSTGAFNALLKILEEPPAHVIFILATTEQHKVPETIQSRCQRFDFTRFSIQDIITKLTAIAKAEGVTCDDGVLEMIALAAQGGMRDAESLFAQVLALEDKKITQQEAASILGTSSEALVLDLIDAFVTKDLSAALGHIGHAVAEGYDITQTCKVLLARLRNVLYETIGTETAFLPVAKDTATRLASAATHTTPPAVVVMLEHIATAQVASAQALIPQLPLEIAAVKICGPSSTPDTPTAPHATPAVKTSSQSAAPEKSAAAPKTAARASLEIFHKNWQAVCAELQKHKTSLATVIRECRPALFDGKTLTLATEHELYKTKIEEPANRLTLIEAIATIVKFSPQIVCTVEKKAHPTHDSSALAAAEKLMGGTLVEDPI